MGRLQPLQQHDEHKDNRNMAKDAMQQMSPQSERSLGAGVPSHKAYAMSGELPGAGADFGVTPMSAFAGRSAQDESRRSRVGDSARGAPPPARNGGGRSQSDADHGPAD